MTKTWMVALAAPALMLAPAGCKYVGDTPTGEEAAEDTADAGEANLAETIGSVGELSTASQLIESAGLETMLEGDAAYTFFLPSDDALKALPEADRERLMSEEGRPELIALLRQHIVPGAVGQEDLMAALDSGSGSVELASTAEAPIAFRKGGEAVRLGKGDKAPKLTGAAKSATNGVVYVIDGLIQPGTS